MKKNTKANRLLLNKETVRNMTTTQLGSARGGALAMYSGGCNSGGVSVPGPSRTDPPGFGDLIGSAVLISG
jgi:hypothetical protein